MRKHLITLWLFNMTFSLQTKAQNNFNNTVHFSSLFKAHSLLSFSHNPSITQTQPSISSLHFPQQVYSAEIKPPSISDLPFFCAMECRLRGRTGLWIKFRTGDDASYERLIRSTGK